MRSDLSIIVYDHYIISSMNSAYFFLTKYVHTYLEIQFTIRALKKGFSSKVSSILILHAQKYPKCNTVIFCPLKKHKVEIMHCKQMQNFNSF